MAARQRLDHEDPPADRGGAVHPATMTQARKNTLTWKPIGSAGDEAPDQPGRQEAVVEALVRGQGRRRDRRSPGRCRTPSAHAASATGTSRGRGCRRGSRRRATTSAAAIVPCRLPAMRASDRPHGRLPRQHRPARAVSTRRGPSGRRRRRSGWISGDSVLSPPRPGRTRSRRTSGTSRWRRRGPWRRPRSTATSTRASMRPHCSHFLDDGHGGYLRLRCRDLHGRPCRVADASVRRSAAAVAVARHDRFEYHCGRCRPPSRPRSRGSWRCPPPRSAAGSSSSSPSAATRSCPARASCRPAIRPCCSRTPGWSSSRTSSTGAETRSYTRAVDYQRVPARRRQAQRLRGGRADAAPPHALRDARQLVASATTSSARRSTGPGTS